METSEKFCLRWNDFETNISKAFRELREDKDFFDVTLACEDEQIQAHKVILSACSPFFKTVLKRNRHEHPLLYLKGVKYADLVAVLNFMYHGEVNVAQEELNTFLGIAEELKIKGLTQDKTKEKDESYQERRKEDLSRISENGSTGPKRVKSSASAAAAHAKTLKRDARYNDDDHNDIEEVEVLPVKTEPVETINTPIPSHSLPVLKLANQQHQTGAVNQNTALVENSDNSAIYGEDFGEYYNDGGEGYEQSETSAGNQDLNSMLDSMISRCDEGDSSGPAKFMCGACGKVMARRKDLRRHVEIHLDVSHPCGICPKVMKTRSSLAAHYSQYHKNEVSSPWSMI